ncbi:class I SAM-dependent methyltransferase [Tepidicaulis sp. LMO-SS28]|uniref:class I SAM-dependent methyltransferase n=1 Tax=Tepidicaulis sp. LMO-SS28 TaxID=3447455 RepID=UPI003EE16D17
MAQSSARPAPACCVCRASAALPFMEVEGLSYWKCPRCEARFLDPAQRPAPADERAEYLRHQNSVEDEGYRRFLSKLAVPLKVRLKPNASGLDYGCGPGPALAAMLREAGHEMAVYDPFFAPDAAPLSRTYDFVTCTETAEHFFDPAAEFDRLGALLKPGGWLAVMTCFQTEDAKFAKWQYRQDPTHVVFYREATLRHIAATRGWHCEIPVKDVALMRV